MVLSSNWLELQQSQGPAMKVAQKNKKNRDHKNVKQKNIRIIKPVNGRKGSKLMDMVHSMSKDIKEAEVNKKEGKKFEFKSKVEATIDDTESSLSSLPNSTKYARSYQNKSKDIGKYIALDCEFVGVGPEGKDSALARVSLVNYFGHIIIDEFVHPRERVTDWRTWVSGVKAENMKNAIPLSEAQQKVSSILGGKILVGHSVKHDLESLLISHPKSMIRDTSRHLPFKQTYSKGKTPSLKKLAKEVLGKDIQESQHSSVEDARITMEIYKKEKKEFERLHQITYGKSK